MPAEGQTPLHSAALERSDALRQLLEQGADVNACDAKGRTPLHNACQKQAVHVPALLAAGANPNARDSNRMTPLHYAAATDSNGHTPLHHAVFLGHHAAAIDLIVAGADPRVADLTGETLFDHIYPWIGTGYIDELWLVDARLHGPDRIAQHLTRLIDDDEYTRIQKVLNPTLLSTHMWWTKDRGPLPLQSWTDLASALSQYCATQGAWYSLHALHICGLPVTLPKAVQDAAQPRRGLFNVPAGKAPMALIQAAVEDGYGVPLLLQLHPAECQPALDAALHLLCNRTYAQYANSDTHNEFRQALNIALQALLEAGAELESRNESVAEKLHTELNQPVGDDGKLLWEDARKLSSRFLAFQGAMQGLMRPVGFTPLLHAAENGSVLVPDLIAAGADSKAVDRFGRNALHLASMARAGTGGEATVETLLSTGLAVDASDAGGWRSLMLTTHAAIVAVLISHGASPILAAEERDKLGDKATRQLDLWIAAAKTS